MQKNLHNTMKWLQTDKIIPSWVNKHNVVIYLFISLKCYMWYVFKIDRIHDVKTTQSTSPLAPFIASSPNWLV
jgi:hypothetical protein